MSQPELSQLLIKAIVPRSICGPLPHQKGIIPATVIRTTMATTENASRKIQRILQIQPGEVMLVLLLAALFFFWEAGRELGSQTATTLYISRVGTQTLPVLYIGLGLGNILISTLYSLGLAFFRPRYYYLALAIVFITILGSQLAAISNPTGGSPVSPSVSLALLWLTVFVGSNLIATMQWSVAGSALDTRQAKRLFSLLASAGFLGAIAAATLARPLSSFYSANIASLFLWQIAFVMLGITVLYLLFKSVSAPEHTLPPSDFLSGLKSGATTVFQLPLLRQVAFSLILFSILFLSLDLLYNSAVNDAFSLENEKLRYLASISASVQILTLLVSIFLTGRLIKRFGVVNANFFLVAAYGFAFSLLLLDTNLTNISIARILQLTTLGGIVQSSNYIFFNVIPAERRAQALSFTFGVVGQIGIILSGILLLLGNQPALRPVVLMSGLALSLAVGLLTWRMRAGYRQALISALRTGRLEVFSIDARPNADFNALQSDPATIDLLIQSTSDPQPLTRRLAIETLAELEDQVAISAILPRMADMDADVRRSALAALHKLKYRHISRWAAEALHDPSVTVRLQALDCLSELELPLDEHQVAQLGQMLKQTELSEQLGVIKTLVLHGKPRPALPALRILLKRRSAQERAEATRTLGEVASALSARNEDSSHLVNTGTLRTLLNDPSPIVRREACRALQHLHPTPLKRELITLLRDPNPSVRQAAAHTLQVHALGRTELLTILSESREGDLVESALTALQPGQDWLQEPIHRFVIQESEALALWRQRAAALRLSGRTARLLSEIIRAEIVRGEIRLILALKLIEPEDNLEWDFVIDSLRSGSSERRSAILETLDTLGDSTVAKELILPALEELAQAEGYREDETFLNPAAALRELIQNGDRWTRALAIAAAAETSATSLLSEIARFNRARDPLVRETAQHALKQLKKGAKMSPKNLQLLSSVERIILLREVPLFATLEINDLKQLAELAREQVIQKDDFVVKQGERGNQLYIIASGEVEIWLNTGKKEEQVALGTTGDFFGEMAVLETAPRSASIRARTPVRALVIDGDAFKAILRDRPEVALTVLRGLSQRIRRANELLSDPKYKVS